MTDRLFPDQGEAIITILQALGVRIVHPVGLNCCGLPANNSGDDTHARSMAKQTIAALEDAHAEFIVSGSASCVATLAQDYVHLLRDEPPWRARAAKLAGRVMDFTTFLANVAELPAGCLAGENPLVVTYHDSCQGLNALDLYDEPRRILRDVLGCEIRELQENRVCCGFGGSFGFDYPEVSERLMNRKLDDAQGTGAPLLVTDNQGCIMHLRGGCDAGHRNLRIKHIAELVAERLKAIDPTL
jgi:Fe-S oxidoreductase